MSLIYFRNISYIFMDSVKTREGATMAKNTCLETWLKSYGYAFPKLTRIPPAKLARIPRVDMLPPILLHRYCYSHRYCYTGIIHLTQPSSIADSIGSSLNPRQFCFTGRTQSISCKSSPSRWPVPLNGCGCVGSGMGRGCVECCVGSGMWASEGRVCV